MAYYKQASVDVKNAPATVQHLVKLNVAAMGGVKASFAFPGEAHATALAKHNT